MEESKKKPIMILFIVGCLVAAGVITLLSRSDSSESDYSGVMMWVKCRNPQCKAEYEMDKQEYRDYMKENQKRPERPPLICEKCAKKSVYIAVKCSDCGLIFEEGAAGFAKPSKQCPKCGHRN